MIGEPSAVMVPSTDPYFRVNKNAMVSRACIMEITLDSKIGNSVIYGPLLLQNRFDRLGRLDGQVIYAMNLGERNTALKFRQTNRRRHPSWCRMMRRPLSRQKKRRSAGTGGEARGGIEPPNGSFADSCLTTWLPRHRVRKLFCGHTFLKEMQGRHA